MGEYFRTQSLRSLANIAIRQCGRRGVALAWVLAVVHMTRQEMHMTRFAMAVGLGAGLLLLAGQADAQWRYTDNKGASKVTQYKLDVPVPYRDAAEWIGPIGIGKPALSADQLAAVQRWEAIQRIVAAEAGLLQFRNVAVAPALPPVDPGVSGRPIPTMCITGELRAMTSPGIWKVIGGCAPGFSTGYGTDGYGSVGGFIVR